MNDSPNGDATSLYLYYDRRNVLLYVGITSRGMVRNSEHNKTKEWWPHVSRQDVRHYATRDDALAVERALIVEHRPPFNSQHNCDHQVLAAAYLRYVDVPSVDYADIPISCAVCSAAVERRLCFYVDYDEVTRVVNHNSAVYSAERAEAHMLALKRLDEVLALVRGTDDAMEAVHAVSGLLGCEVSHANSFVKRPIFHLTGGHRCEIEEEYAATRGSGNPELAHWRIAHSDCVIDQPVTRFFATLPTEGDLIEATSEMYHDWSWMANTDWRSFSSEYVRRWSHAA
jgi:predicted GIY-YIG superfamily endonuclease